MADPLSLADFRLLRLRSRVKEVKTNRTGCQLLVSVAERTLAILHEVEATQFESSIVVAPGLIDDVLQYTQDVVEKCCNVSFFYSLLNNETFTLELKHVAEKLEHILTAIHLASVKMKANVQCDVDELLARIRNATFEDMETTSHHSKALKDALGIAFHQSGQAYEDRRTHISQLLQDLTLNKEDHAEMLLVHGEFEEEETKDSKKQQKLEIDQAHGHLLDTFGDVSDAQEIVHDLKDCLRCPISKKIMTEPAILKDSGMTYDRSSIQEWLERGHGYDPLTHVELVSSDLVPIPALQIACQTMSEQSRAHFSNVENSQEVSRQKLEPGLFEGQEELIVGSEKGQAYHLLILEPNGDVVGCTMYKEKDSGDQKDNVEIGFGKWDGGTSQLSFKNNHYHYHGNVECLANDTQRRLKWNRNVSALNDPDKEFPSPLICSPPSNRLSGKLHSTVLQIEGNIESVSSQTTQKSRLVLSLETSFTIGGWTYFESSVQESASIGHIKNGRWDENGRLAFSIHFTPEKAPSNFIKAFNLWGIISHDETLNQPTFTSIVTKIKNKDMLQNVKKNPTVLDGVKYVEYKLVSEVSQDWHDLYQKDLHLFRIPKNTNFASLHAVSKSKYDIKHFDGLDLRHASVESSLHAIVRNNNIDILKKLIAEGENVNLLDTGGWSPLHIACESNQTDCVKGLITNGAIINLPDNNERTPLHIASQNNHVNVVKELISNGAYIECGDNRGRTPLHIASRNNAIDVVKKLIASGANIGCKDKDEQTPLHIATSHNAIDVVKELIVNGANVNLQKEDGWSPLHIASQNGHIGVVKELIVKGANVNLQANNGTSPLYIASYNNQIDVVKDLIVNGADINLQAKDGRSPLRIASQKGHIDVVQDLIVNGADVNLQSKNGRSPLHIAAQNGHIDIVKELVSNGGSIDYQDRSGTSALHIVTRNGHVSMVQILLEHGASKDIKDFMGKTPYDVACMDVLLSTLEKNTIRELKVLSKK